MITLAWGDIICDNPASPPGFGPRQHHCGEACLWLQPSSLHRLPFLASIPGPNGHLLLPPLSPPPQVPENLTRCEGKGPCTHSFTLHLIVVLILRVQIQRGAGDRGRAVTDWPWPSDDSLVGEGKPSPSREDLGSLVTSLPVKQSQEGVNPYLG